MVVVLVEGEQLAAAESEHSVRVRLRVTNLNYEIELC